MESMSYRYGGLHDSCVEYEVITGTGEVITCSPEQDADLFHMLHGSYGTLGILSRVKLKLYPAKKYVKVENRLHHTFEAYWADLLERCEKGDYTFVDGIIHGRDAFVLCLGEYVDEAPYTSDYEGEKIEESHCNPDSSKWEKATVTDWDTEAYGGPVVSIGIDYRWR